MIGIDRHYMSLAPASGELSVVVREDGVDLVATIPESTYLNYFGPTLLPLNAPLLNALLTAINAVTSATYTFEAATPLGSTLDGAGLALAYASGPVLDVGWNPGHASWTLDSRWLGIPTGTTSLVDYGASPVLSPVSRWGVWQAPTFAVDKRSFGRARVDVNKDVPYGLETVRPWYTDRGRRIRYDRLPGAHVRRGLGTLLEYTQAAGLAPGDTHNALEDLWEYLALGGELTSSYEVDTGDLSLGDEYETSRLLMAEAHASFEAVAELVQPDGEIYQATLALRLGGVQEYTY